MYDVIKGLKVFESFLTFTLHTKWSEFIVYIGWQWLILQS